MTRALGPAKTKAAANSLLVTAAVTAGLVLLNVAAGRVRTRYDLTSAGLYSLTPASRKLVADLKETVVATAYFGHVPPDQYYMQEFLESMLEEYAAASGGKFTWSKIDPFERGREFQKQLEADGVQKIMLLTEVDDAPKQEPVYFHIQFSYLDKKELWAPRGNLSLSGIEYVFSSLIKQVAFPRKKIAVSQGAGEPQEAKFITSFLSQLYDVSPVDLTQEGVDLTSYDLVIVNGPTTPIPQPGVLALDQHVMAGKPVMFLLRGMAWQSGGDPNLPPEMQDAEQPYLGVPADDGLGPLLAHYGIQGGRDVIIDGRESATGVIPMGREPLITKAFFPLVRVQGEAAALLPGLDIVPLPFASTLALTGPLAGGATAEIKVIPLFRSSPSSFRRAEMLPVTRETSVTPSPGEHGPYVTGYALEGSFTSLVADAADPAVPAVATSAQQSSPSTRLVVIGSAEFAGDLYMSLAQRYPQFQLFGAGRLVLADLIDWLAQDQALLAARAKEAPRPLDPLDRSDRLLLQYGNLAGAPLLLCLFGIVWWRLRERRRRHVSL